MVLTKELLVKMVCNNYPISEDAFLDGMSNNHFFEVGQALHGLPSYLCSQDYSIDFYRKLFPLIRSRLSSDDWLNTNLAWSIQYPKEVLTENENVLSFPDAFKQKALPFDVALRHLTVNNSLSFISCRHQEFTEEFIRNNIDVLNIEALLVYSVRKLPMDLLLDNYKKQNVSFGSLSTHPELPIKFIAARPSRFNWLFISKYHELTDEFVSAFGNRIRWESVGERTFFQVRVNQGSSEKPQFITQKAVEDHIDKMFPSFAFLLLFLNHPMDFENFTRRHIEQFTKIPKSNMKWFLTNDCFSVEFLNEYRKVFATHKLLTEWQSAVNRKLQNKEKV